MRTFEDLVRAAMASEQTFIRITRAEGMLLRERPLGCHFVRRDLKNGCELTSLCGKKIIEEGNTLHADPPTTHINAHRRDFRS